MRETAHGIGRTKGGRNTKLHAVCDAKGRPLVLLLTPGHSTAGPRGHGDLERGTTAVIPPRKNRKVQYHYDKTVYRQRNIIERMFCRLKDWRRIATRFDRNIKNFIAAIALAAAVIWWL